MDEMKVCPHCKFANVIDATLCDRCATNLVPLLTARVTPSVPEQSVKPKPPNHDAFITKLEADSLLLVIAGTEQPIFVRKNRMTVLGREVSSEATSRVDLTPYDGLLLGVSRQHASIEITKTSYVIRDLESTNGTWLNGMKLVPHRVYKLESGDLVRLGQMGIYIYFQNKPVTTITCTLKDMTTSTTALTPDYLSTKVAPYLTQLAEVHDFVDTLLQRTKLMIGISKLSWDPVTYRVHLDLRMDDELLYFLGTTVSKWKVLHEVEIRKIREIEENTDWLIASPQSDSSTAAFVELKQKLYTPLAQLVGECLSQLAPDLSEQEKAASSEKLLPVFYRLILSPLQLVHEPLPEYSN